MVYMVGVYEIGSTATPNLSILLKKQAKLFIQLGSSGRVTE